MVALTYLFVVIPTDGYQWLDSLVTAYDSHPKPSTIPLLLKSCSLIRW